MTNKLDRFCVGFIASAVLPVLKYMQTGAFEITQEQLKIGYILGVCLPIFVMGNLVGVYAIFVENKEDDLKRLFRTCFALPGVLLTLSSGPSMSEVNASSIVIPDCKVKEASFLQGVEDAWRKITAQNKLRYYILSTSGYPGDAHIKVVRSVYYIKGRSDEVPDSEFYFDEVTCRLIRNQR